METLNNDDFRNIILLIQKANITGAEATPVAILLQKIGKLLEPKEPITNETGSKSDKKA